MIGPRIKVKVSCFDCEHERAEYYRAQGDSGYKVSCAHPQGRGSIGDTTWNTPSWCPLLADALAAAMPAPGLPRLLAPGEEIPPGCTASLRAAIVSEPAAQPPVRYFAGYEPVPEEQIEAELAEARANRVPVPSGPYTRAQFAAAVDGAHAALHELENLPIGRSDAETIDRAFKVSRLLSRAHEALHRVGAGLERVDCATADPEAQAAVRDLIEAGKAPLPCGHEVRHLVGWTYAATGATETRCGACIDARGRTVLPAVPSRSFLPQGCTPEQIATAAGVAARELVAEHGAPAGTLVEVRLVRRGGQAPVRQDVVANVRKARAVAEAQDIREAQERVDALRAGVASYAGGDRAPSPPARLLRELREAEDVLRDLRGES